MTAPLWTLRSLLFPAGGVILRMSTLLCMVPTKLMFPDIGRDFVYW